MARIKKRSRAWSPVGIRALDDTLGLIHAVERTWKKQGDPLVPLRMMQQAYTVLAGRGGKNAGIYLELSDRLSEVVDAEIVR